MTVDDAVTPDSDASGWEAAYLELFDAHFTGMVRLAALLGADDPDDVAQEAFVRLFHRRAVLRDPQAALPYLRRTVANLSRSRLRHLRVVARHRHGERPPPAVPSAEHTAVRLDVHRRLLDAVAQLRPRHREVVVLRYWVGLPLDDIASTLRIPSGTVRSTLHRAHTALAHSLGETR